nr:phenylacetaldehyde oxime monooxygenase CYP71AN24-like [Ziziphus jujuba var. spinosa]
MVINLSELLIATLSNTVLRCILERKFQENDSRSLFGEISKRVMIRFGSFSFGVWRFLSLVEVGGSIGLIAKSKATFRELDVLLEPVIEEHKVRSSEEFSSDEKKDFMDILLQLQKDVLLDMEPTNVNIKAILLVSLCWMRIGLFQGKSNRSHEGSDTTSATVEWAMTELLKDESKMKKAQDEVRRVIGKKSTIEVNDIYKMDYLKCVVKEALTENAKPGGYDIPSKTRVLINVWAIHRDGIDQKSLRQKDLSKTQLNL